MSTQRKSPDDMRRQRLVAEVRRDREKREQSYREKALKLFPWVCARCGREFSGKKLRELTVHHRDHNHDNNPSDGSNWELLCVYCHDNEHARQKTADAYGETRSEDHKKSETGFRPFADLDSLLKNNQ